MDGFNMFPGNKLPDNNDLYSSLKDKGISDKDCKHVVDIWNAFEMKAMGNYHDFYLKTDLLLLVDV